MVLKLENESPPPPPRHQTRQSVPSSSNHKRLGKYCSNPSHSSFFLPEYENIHVGRFDANRFCNFECWKNYIENISFRPIIKPFLVDLVSFKEKGLHFIPLFHYQE